MFLTIPIGDGFHPSKNIIYQLPIKVQMTKRLLSFKLITYLILIRFTFQLINELPMKTKLLLFSVLLFGGISISASAQFHPMAKISNPFYNSKAGKAVLINGENIQGKFYYHSPPLSDDDSFYFYPSDAKSLKIIPIKDVKQAEFLNKNKEWVKFISNDGKLKRTLSDNKIEILNAHILSHM